MLTKGALLAFAVQASAFPWVLDTLGKPRDYFGHVEKRQMPGSAATCPNNPNHKGAVPISAKYPYCGAKNGLPGFQVCVNNKVPADVGALSDSENFIPVLIFCNRVTLPINTSSLARMTFADRVLVSTPQPTTISSVMTGKKLLTWLQ